MSYSNLSVICSISETFSLVCAEAMALGQPILRNRTGGWHEQLIVGETGFDLGRPEVSPSSANVNLLHLLRQKESIPDAKLSALSRYAVKQSNSFQHINVTEWLR